MSIVDDIAQDLSDERFARWEVGHNHWSYGVQDTAALHAAFKSELRAYPDEVGVTCEACGQLQHVSLTITCQECGEVICITHPPTCPHMED